MLIVGGGSAGWIVAAYLNGALNGKSTERNIDITLGLSLNCRLISKDDGLTEIKALEKEFAVPCFGPMLTGVSSLVNTL